MARSCSILMAAPTSAALPKAALLYSVFRPLIRLAPSEEIREHIRQAFRRNRRLTQPGKVGRKVGEAQEVSPRSSELSAK